MMLIGRLVLLKQVAVVKMVVSQVEKHCIGSPLFWHHLPVINFVLQSSSNFRKSGFPPIYKIEKVSSMRLYCQ